MGDRGNIYFRDDVKRNHGVYLYSHWGGYGLPKLLQSAIRRAERAGRLNDPAYFCRIVFCEMVKDDITGSTGYGISATITDNEHDILVVDTETQTVGVAKEPENGTDPQPEPFKTWSFKEFLEVTDLDGFEL